MMLNKTWSVLVKGVQYYNPTTRVVTAADYQRNVGYAELLDLYFGQFVRVTSEEAYVYDALYDPLVDALVDTSSPLMSCLYTEQILQLILRSDLRSRLLQEDPKNLYVRAPLTFPEAGVNVSGTPIPVYHYDRGDSPRLTAEGIVAVECTVDPAALTIIIDGETEAFTMTGQLSSYIELLPNKVIRFQNAMPASTFRFVVIYTDQLVMDWPGVLAAVTLMEDSLVWEDVDLRIVWENDGSWVNRLAAAALLAVETQMAAG